MSENRGVGINICDLFLFLWGLYAVHWCMPGMIPAIDALSNIFLLLGLTISFYYFVLSHTQYKLPVFLYVVDILLLFFTIYGILSIAQGQVIKDGEIIDSKSYLISIYRSFLPIYAFYVFSTNGKLSNRKMCIWTIVLLCVYIYSYISISTFKFSLYDKEGFTFNVGYKIVSVFPLLILFKKKPIVMYALLCITFFYVLMCMKRGAIIIGFILFAIIIISNYKNQSKNIRIISAIIGVLLLYGVAVYMVDLYQNNLYFQMRVDDTLSGNSSGRDSIYSSYLKFVTTKTSFLSLLFGSGADATVRLFQQYAHNDWVEILVNNGVLGLFMYLIFWIAFYKEYRKINNQEKKMMFGLFLFLSFSETLFSMSYSCIPINVAMGMGFSLSKDCRCRKSFTMQTVLKDDILFAGK